jgi:phage terminase Nu1 subunit (DNA packaging protein)
LGPCYNHGQGGSRQSAKYRAVQKFVTCLHNTITNLQLYFVKKRQGVLWGLVRKAEFARMRNVSRAAVGAWHRRGLLVLDGALIDVDASTAKLDARPEVYRGGRAKELPKSPAAAVVRSNETTAQPKTVSAKPSAPALSDEPSSWTTAEAIRRKETANALVKQLEYEAKAGKLMDEDAVRREWAGILGDVKAGMLAVSSRCASRLGHLTQAEVAEIDAEIRAVLQELGGGHDAR